MIVWTLQKFVWHIVNIVGKKITEFTDFDDIVGFFYIFLIVWENHYIWGQKVYKGKHSSVNQSQNAIWVMTFGSLGDNF